MVKRRLTSLLLASLIFSANVTPLFANNEMNARTGTNVGIVDGTVDVETEVSEKGDTYVDVNITHNDADRIVSELDAVKLNYFNSSANMDYKPRSIKDNVKDIVPEIKLADIIEYSGVSNGEREQLIIESESGSEYAGRVKYLIENNIINRNTYFLFDELGAYSSFRRIQNPIDGKLSPTEGDRNNKPIFYSANDAISKTDFLVQLLKTNEVLESKPIITQRDYTRISTGLEEVKVLSEPLESSIYSRYMGELGIDPNSHDVVVNHKNFRQLDIILTSDVVEQYLSKALSLNIIKETDIGGVEGDLFLTQYSNSSLRDGWKNTKLPARQFYNPLATSEKKFGENIIYQKEQYENALTNNGQVALGSDCLDSGILYIWGNSYSYNKSKCSLVNPYSKSPTEIVKRPSSVQARSGFKTPNNDKGYQYFKEEEISVAEAYVLAYEHLRSIGYEPTIINPDYVNTMYSLNLTSFTEEERKATEYLIFSGIVNGDDLDLSKATSNQLTNEVAVDIVYRLHNKDARYKLEQSLSETDKDMARRGFSRADVEVSNDASPTANIYFKKAEGDEDDDGLAPNYLDKQIKDRAKNPYQYDTLYIRVPKTVVGRTYGTDVDSPSDGYYGLVTNDRARIPIDPINNRAFNGGGDNKHDTSGLKEGEDLYALSNRYVFKDSDGYEWERYLVHKDLSNKVMFTAFSSKGTVTLGGISGEGVYYIEEGKGTGNFTKVTTKDAKTNPHTKRINEMLIEHDMDVKVKLQTNKATASAVNQVIDKKRILWKQSSFANPNLNLVMSAVYSSITEEQMPYMTYKGMPMFEKEGSDWKLAPDLPMDADVRNGYKLEKRDDGRYDLLYTGTTQSEIEGYSELSFVDRGASSDDGSAVNTLGYAKVNANGEATVIISEDELSFFEISRADKSNGEKSDKGLFNKRTGQRAFIDTDLDVTLIGNNITHYPDNHMMVMSINDKIYYNLSILMEMINDTNAVNERAGKNILVGTSLGIDGTEKHQLTNVYDVLNKSDTEEHKIIDRTYIMSKKEDTSGLNYYMNLSALTSSASNFIYYKNRDGKNEFDLLLAFKPNVGEEYIKHDPTGIDKTSSTFTENGIFNTYHESKKNSNNSNINISNQASTNNKSYAKDLVFDKLFKMGEGYGSNVLPGDYLIDLNIINTSSADGSHTEGVKNFLNFVTDGNDAIHKKFLESVEYDSAALGIDEVETDVSQKGLVRLKSIKAATSLDQSELFLVHPPTGNLYFKIIKDGKPETILLQDTIYQRFYYDKEDKKISLRKKQYFENTPANYIPLEKYGKDGSNQFGALESTTDGVTNGYNFPLKNQKLSTPKNSNGKYDSNMTLPIVEDGVSDYGLTTRVEVPYRTVTPAFISSILGAGDSSHKVIFEKTMAYFGEKLDNKYPIEEAMGTSRSVVSLGYFNNLSPENVRSFMTGSWGGMDREDGAYYTPVSISDSEGKPITNYVLTVGKDILGNKTVDGGDMFYLTEIETIYPDFSYYTTKGKPKAINKYKDLPNDIRELMEDGSEDKVTRLPIHYKPSMAIPAGTTLVSNYGDLVYKPNPNIRGNLNHATDIINNMLARMQELDNLADVNLLAEVDKNSVVEFSTSSGSTVKRFIKISEKQSIDTTKPLKWERMLLIPEGDQEEYTINEAVLAYEAMQDLESITLFTQNGIGVVSLFDVIGPSQFRLPGKEEFLDTLKYHRNSTTSWLKHVDSLFLIDNISNISGDKDKNLYGHNLYKIKDKKLEKGTEDAFDSQGKKKSGQVLKVYYLPPTIQVEDKTPISNSGENLITSSDNFRTYKATKYWDIGAFNIDPNDKAINILKSHDTPADSIEGILDSMRKSGMDGTYYTRYTFIEYVKLIWDYITAFLLRGIPMLIMLIWLLVSLLTVIYGFNKTKEWGDKINRRFGKDIIAKLTFGTVDVYAESFNVPKYLVVSAFIFGLAFLAWDGYIIRLAINLFIGDGAIFSFIGDGFRSIFSM